MRHRRNLDGHFQDLMLNYTSRTFRIPEGTRAGDLLRFTLPDGTESSVRCPSGIYPGENIDLRELVAANDDDIDGYLRWPIFQKTSKCAAASWILITFILFGFLCAGTSMESWVLISINDNCNQRYYQDNIIINELYVSSYLGVGTSLGCKENDVTDFCLKFSDSSTWNSIDDLISSHMSADATERWPTLQSLLPFSILCSAISLFIFGLYFSIYYLSKKNSVRIQCVGSFVIFLAGLSAFFSQYLVNNSDILNVRNWQKLFRAGYQLSNIVNSDTKLNSTLYASKYSMLSRCKVTLDMSTTGTVAITYALYITSFLLFIILFNGCGGHICCAVCVDQEDEEDDYGESNNNSEDSTLYSRRLMMTSNRHRNCSSSSSRFSSNNTITRGIDLQDYSDNDENENYDG